MKKLISLIFVFALLWKLLLPKDLLAAEPKTFKVGAFNNFPIIYMDTDGIIKGMYVDLLTEIGKKENIKFEYVFGSWNDGLERIKSGEVDLLTSVGYTEERNQTMDYTQNPLLTVWGEVYTAKESNLVGVLEVAGKKIGTMRGDINSKNFQDLMSKFDLLAEYVEFESYDEIFKAVENKTIDAGVVGITFGMSNETKYDLKSTGIVFNPISLYFTTTKGKNGELIAVLDKYLSYWRGQKNSFFDLTKNKWMKGAYGGAPNLPTWLPYVSLGLGISLVMGLVFVLLLKQRISRVTNKIRLEAEALDKSEKKYQFLVDNMQELAIIIDGEGIIKFANNYTFKLLEYSQEEMLEKSILDFIPEEFHENTFSMIGEEFKGNPQSGFEIKIKNKNGEERILQVADTSSSIYENGKMIKLLISAIDITKQKLAENELIESKMALQAKIDELEKFQKLTVDRELRMSELKGEMEELKKK
ncbi:MAG: transporter substrate-binding domain-containing protein [Candidatus Shapirobacteria bacterium]